MRPPLAPKRTVPWLPSAVLGALVVAVSGSCSGGCGGAAEARRYAREDAQETLATLESPELLLGEMALASDGVVDGDTLKVEGLDTTLRLLAIDTEETFKKEKDRRAVEADWAGYRVAQRGERLRPAKYATPLGEEAKQFAKAFFAGVERVRLERDHPKEIRGRYGRYLAYVFAFKDGRWRNYNVEAVRAGMSPYFTKYGYSRRFHDEFVAAEAEARKQQLGIWDPAKRHYPDYDERTAWWNARADFIAAFEASAGDKADHIALTNWDAIARLEQHLGKEVTLLGSVGAIRLGDRGPTRVLLSRRMFNDFPLIFFDKDVFGTSNIARFDGEYIVVRGFVSEYEDRRKKRRVLQIVVDRPGQISGSEKVPGLPKAEESL